MPQVIKNMGYTSANAQLLTIPPYTLGAIVTIISAYFADKWTWRMPVAVAADICIIIAHAILYSYGPDLQNRIPECYFALFIACVGFYPIPPAVNAWLMSNMAPVQKRAMGIGLFIGLGNIGGIFGSFLYRDSEAPTYPTGYGTAFALAGLGAVCALILEFNYKRINKKRSQMSEDEVRALYTDDQLKEMGDRSPLFQYTL